MGALKNSTETQQSGHPSRSGPKRKNRAKIAPKTLKMWDIPEGGEPDGEVMTADAAKNYVLSC